MRPRWHAFRQLHERLAVSATTLAEVVAATLRADGRTDMQNLIVLNYSPWQL